MFLKGCTLHCPWCCNPETIRWEPEPYIMPPSCTADAGSGTRGTYGRWVERDTLVDKVLKDRPYYDASGGGVTLSGGEPLAHSGIVELLGALKAVGLNCTVETSLFVQPAVLRETIPLVDLFLVDIKILDPAVCKEVIGGDLNLYLHNVDFLVARAARIQFRMPVVKPYTMLNSHISRLISFILENRLPRVDLLPVHTLGKRKYASLGLDAPPHPEVGPAELENLRSLVFRRTGAVAEVQT